MPRAKSVVTGKARKKKVLHANKGAFHGRRKLLRTAKENMWRGLNFAYQGRKQKKRAFRSLWILRINAAARACGISYSRFISGMKVAGIVIDRKSLADLAVHDQAAFASIVEAARAAAPAVPEVARPKAVAAAGDGASAERADG
jgi:large subunit ribosomal protein L20